MKKTKGPCTDHLGQEFPSEKARAEAYSQNVYTVRDRIRHGATLEEALTTKKPDPPKCEDWACRCYRNKVDMAEKLHVSIKTLKRWIDKYGDYVNASRFACTNSWPRTHAGKYYIRECIEFPWFLCEDTDNDTEAPHANELILHADRILELKDQDRAAKEEA